MQLLTGNESELNESKTILFGKRRIRNKNIISFRKSKQSKRKENKKKLSK